MSSENARQRVESRSELTDVQHWSELAVDMLPAVPGQGNSRTEAYKALSTWYFTADRPVALTVLQNLHDSKFYVLPGAQSFYLWTGDDMLGALVGPGELRLRRPFFVSDHSRSLSAAISEFLAATDDLSLVTKDRSPALYVVDLRRDTRPTFWTAASGASSQPGRPTVVSVSMVEKEMQLRLRSDGGRYEGTFWLSWPDVRLVRTVIENAK